MNESDDQLVQPEPETLDLIFDLVRASPDEQLRATDAVDAKIVQTFTAASVLIGLATIGGVKHHETLTAALVAIAVSSFLVVAYHSIRALWTRAYRAAISPPQLWNEYWDQGTDVIKHAYVVDIATGHATNERHIKDKHEALRLALVFLLIEAGAIGVALVVSTL
jgi:hypothetical protein